MCKIYIVGEKDVNVSRVRFMAPLMYVPCWIYSNGLVVPKDPRSIPSHVHCNVGNDKVGQGAIMFNLPIFFSCRRDSPCFCTDDGGKAPCYACGGLFIMYGNVIIPPWGNWNALVTMTEDEFFGAMVAEIERLIADSKTPITVFRWMEQGDFVPKLIRVAIRLAERFPEIDFYGYTKKYNLWNSYVASHGNSLSAALPHNLTIRFSSWEGLPMDNPYNFPVSGFLPAGSDVALTEDSVICPCSDPEWAGTCCECRQCITCKDTVWLMEHSTPLTKCWDNIAHDGQRVCKLIEISRIRPLSDKDALRLYRARKRLRKKGINPDTLRPRHTVSHDIFSASAWVKAHSLTK